MTTYNFHLFWTNDLLFKDAISIENDYLASVAIGGYSRSAIFTGTAALHAFRLEVGR
jgi:hypothetical protein